MTTDEGGRTTTGFTTYAYNPEPDGQNDGGLTVDDVETRIVDDRTVMFV